MAAAWSAITYQPLGQGCRQQRLSARVTLPMQGSTTELLHLCTWSRVPISHRLVHQPS